MPHFKEDGFAVYLTQPHVRAKEWNCLPEYDMKGRPRVKYVERFTGDRFFIVIRIDPSFKYGDADALAFKLTTGTETNLRWLAAKPSDQSQAVAFVCKVTLDRKKDRPEVLRRYTINVEAGKKKESYTSYSIENRKWFNKHIGVSFAAVSTARCGGDVLDFYQSAGLQLPGQHVISVHNFKFQFQAAESLPAIPTSAKMSHHAIANPTSNAQAGWVDMIVGHHSDRVLSTAPTKKPKAVSRARSPKPSGDLRGSDPEPATGSCKAPPQTAPDAGNEHVHVKDEVGERILDVLESIPSYAVPYKRAALEEGLIATMPKVNTDACQPSLTTSHKRAATDAPDPDRAAQRPKVFPERESAPAAVSESTDPNVERAREAQRILRGAYLKMERLKRGSRESAHTLTNPTERIEDREKSWPSNTDGLPQKEDHSTARCRASASAIDSRKAIAADPAKDDGTSRRIQALKPVITTKTTQDAQSLGDAKVVGTSVPAQRPGLAAATTEAPVKKAPSESPNPTIASPPALVQALMPTSMLAGAFDEDDEEELELELRKIEIQQRLMRLRKQRANIKKQSVD